MSAQLNQPGTLPTSSRSRDVLRDFVAGTVVFLVALPLCLGIAFASDAPLFSGLLAGIIGGIVVGAISGSHTSVSGPAAGLTAIVAAQISGLGSFEAFLLAVFFAGLIQILLGVMRAGALSAFFPSSVIKGLLAAIGVILILKQFPHVLGHDSDPEGEMSFVQPDEKNTFTELLGVFSGDVHVGAAVIGIAAILLLVMWDRIKPLKKSLLPSQLVVVLFGVFGQLLFRQLGAMWTIESSHLVQIPVADSLSGVTEFLTSPDWSLWNHWDVYFAAVTIAVVASLETLLNLEASDKLDPLRRNSEPSRELIAQGVGNTLAGLVGGLPMTSVIVRSSVNVNIGAKSKLSTIVHGVILLIAVVFIPAYLNMIPLSALAAILLVTGFKLASPKLFREMYSEGRYQFLPFLITLLSIVFTDLLIGVVIGLIVNILFILNSNLRRPVRRIVEAHIGGEILHIELPNQVSFLNKAALDKVFRGAPDGGRILIDATETDYMDPDVLSLIRDFKDHRAPARGVSVSLRGFRDKYQLQDVILFADYTSRELQDRVTPQQVLEILQEGNRRFQDGNRLTRDFRRQVDATALGQTPLAAILSCIDSRVPTELVFDLGIGDIFSVRVAGNVIGSKSLGSIEYAVAVAGVKLVVVMGHTRCGAVTSSVQLLSQSKDVQQATGCDYLNTIVDEIAHSVDSQELKAVQDSNEAERSLLIEDVAKRNVRRTVTEIAKRSTVIRQAVQDGRIMIVGAIYDVNSGAIEFLEPQ